MHECSIFKSAKTPKRREADGGSEHRVFSLQLQGGTAEICMAAESRPRPPVADDSEAAGNLNPAERARKRRRTGGRDAPGTQKPPVDGGQAGLAVPRSSRPFPGAAAGTRGMLRCCGDVNADIQQLCQAPRCHGCSQQLTWGRRVALGGSKAGRCSPTALPLHSSRSHPIPTLVGGAAEPLPNQFGFRWG